MNDLQPAYTSHYSLKKTMPCSMSREIIISSMHKAIGVGLNLFSLYTVKTKVLK